MFGTKYVISPISVFSSYKNGVSWQKFAYTPILQEQPFLFPITIKYYFNYFKQNLNCFLSQKHAQNSLILF